MSYFTKSAKAKTGKFFRMVNFNSGRIMDNLPAHFAINGMIKMREREGETV